MQPADAHGLDISRDHGIAYLPWGPLAAKPFAPAAPLSQNERLAEIAPHHSATEGQIALAWLRQRAPNILLIPGTTSLGHLEENVLAQKIRLTHSESAAVESLYNSD